MPQRILSTRDVGLDEELDLIHARLDGFKAPAAPAHVAPSTSVSSGASQQIPSELDDLGDASISSPSAGDVLSYDGSQWSNNQISGDGAYITTEVSGGDTVLALRRRSRYRLRRG